MFLKLRINRPDEVEELQGRDVSLGDNGQTKKGMTGNQRREETYHLPSILADALSSLLGHEFEPKVIIL
jgi:hypothetical protein